MSQPFRPLYGRINIISAFPRTRNERYVRYRASGLTRKLREVLQPVPARLVLIVEDDADLRAALVEALSARGFETLAAADGLEALSALREHAIDVVILDLVMPQMDGWTFRAQQKRDPSIESIPVIVLTAVEDATASAIDADLVLRKPVDLGSLVRSIELVAARAERQRIGTTLAHQERLASLGVIAAGIAHELNNPLAVVLMGLSVATNKLEAHQGPSDTEEVLEALKAATAGAEHARRIISDVMLLARAEELASEVDVREIVKSCLTLLEAELRDSAELQLALESTPLVRASRGQLGQVLVNLLMNACHAVADTTSAKIRICTRAGADGWAVVEISNNGPLIPAALQSRVFDPFFSTKPPGKGAGLGLSISHDIVVKLGGRIELVSDPDQTLFRVILPAAMR